MSMTDVVTRNATDTTGQDTRGCPRTLPATPGEQLRFGIAVDQSTDAVDISSIVDGDVATIDGRRCTPTYTHGCRPQPHPARSRLPGGSIALDSSTAYVPNNDDGNVSMFSLEHR
jgi:hypothetical protein